MSDVIGDATEKQSNGASSGSDGGGSEEDEEDVREELERAQATIADLKRVIQAGNKHTAQTPAPASVSFMDMGGSLLEGSPVQSTNTSTAVNQSAFALAGQAEWNVPRGRGGRGAPTPMRLHSELEELRMNQSPTESPTKDR
jgi:hypothetical protein